MATRPHRIQLKGEGHYEEYVGSGVIRPGDLVDLTTADKLIKHATAGGRVLAQFALEDALQGRTIETNYADGERIFAVTGHPGDRFYAWLSGGETAVIGSLLSSNGDGALKVAGGSDHVVAEALEAIDASDSNDVDARIRVRVV